MARLLFRLGSLLVISRRHKRVRSGVVFIVTHFLVAAAAVFMLEMVLILLGVGDVFLPLTREAWDTLSRVLL